MPWDTILTYAATAIASGIAGGGAYKIIDSIVNGLRLRGDHKLSFVEQLDKLRKDATIERKQAIDALDEVRAKVVTTERDLISAQSTIERMTYELEVSRAAERECQKRLGELSDSVRIHSQDSNSKYRDLEIRLRQLEQEVIDDGREP